MTWYPERFAPDFENELVRQMGTVLIILLKKHGGDLILHKAELQ